MEKMAEVGKSLAEMMGKIGKWIGEGLTTLWFGKQSKDGEVICDYSDITQERVEEIIKSINSDYTIEYPKPYGQLMLIAYIKHISPVISKSTWWQD